MESLDDRLQCSFCHKAQVEVFKLIAGDGVWICDECVRACSDIIEADNDKLFPPAAKELANIKEYLELAVVGQDAALRVLVAVVRQHLVGGISAVHSGPTTLFVGPSGCGKSTMTQALCTASSLPSHHAHVGRLTATGFVGEDVESVLYEITRHTPSHELAERGILVLDDLHLCGAREPSEATATRDITGAGVQRALLRVLDDQACRLSGMPNRHPQDPGQKMFRTQALLRVMTYTMDEPPRDELALRERLVADGMWPELLNKIDLVVPMRTLGPLDLRAVLDRKGIGLLRDTTRLIAECGGRLVFTPNAIELMARRAAESSAGAWALQQQLARLTNHLLADEIDGEIEVDTELLAEAFE